MSTDLLSVVDDILDNVVGVDLPGVVDSILTAFVNVECPLLLLSTVLARVVDGECVVVSWRVKVVAGRRIGVDERRMCTLVGEPSNRNSIELSDFIVATHDIALSKAFDIARNNVTYGRGSQTLSSAHNMNGED